MKNCDVQSRNRCCVVMRESGKWFSQSLAIWLVGHDFGSVKDPSVTQFPSLSNQNFSCIITVELQGSETIHTGCVAQSWYMLALHRRAHCGASRCCFGGCCSVREAGLVMASSVWLWKALCVFALQGMVHEDKPTSGQERGPFHNRT